MFAKIEISGLIEIVTGMHIGGSSEFSAIGAVDAPVIRDTLSRKPILPGSSLKGKMRTLLAYSGNQKAVKIENDSEEIKRLFGGKKDDLLRTGRLIFSDMVLGNKEDLLKKGAQSITEVKIENSINRLTGVANPRQIERVIRGSVFPLSLIYNVDVQEEIVEDFKNIVEGIKLLQYDYLGGHGTRGYGKVKFEELEARLVVGELDNAVLETCNNLLKEV